MTSRRATDILDVQFLEMRSWLLDLAAAMDRIERGEDSAEALSAPQRDLLTQAVEILNTSGIDRAERIQMLLSDPYDPDWDQE